MLENLKNIFRKRPKEAPSSRPTGQESRREQGEEPGSALHELRWLEPEESPFGIRVLDCRPVALSMTSVTQDPAVAFKFSQLRTSLGAEHVGCLPEESVEVACDLDYTVKGRSSDGPLFKAQEMEDKWDVYLYEGHLYFARSWTGTLVARARLTVVEPKAYVDRIDVSAPAADDPVHVVRQIDYLIKSHLYRQPCPHPFPESVRGADADLALYSFSLYGRRGLFGSYEDTIAVRPFPDEA